MKSIATIKEELVEEAKTRGVYEALVSDRTGFSEAIREIAAGRETVEGAVLALTMDQGN